MPYVPSYSSQMFEHLPLLDPATHIRLIEIDAGNETSDGIEIFIDTTAVEYAPPYHSISYTWGDLADQEHIRVQHRVEHGPEIHSNTRASDGLTAIRKNCADVLRQLRYFEVAKHYCIGAICVD
ncbi:hypothetical protein EKO04_004206 [Ascochyta lentis]|uniref:Heterokaryon incompatibility domain-containing protein n=1 Tax=Ascochyta lentis TaxID=205686 RepID=A0A8H7J4H3_9PLEO|nr:hypothetical protein EKO04_004206 [Ascochyta lentis]